MIKLFEMFAGYGGASFGLKKANIEFECVGYSEIDKNAIKLYEQNHKGHNYGDCSKIKTEDLPDFDLLTGGFPCQDVSIAGNRDLKSGRTNLYLEILRIAKHKKPKYMLLENVKGLISMKVNERHLHLKIVSDLNKIGYDVCWKVLNSKDYGIPQNRERIWFVCKLGKWSFMEFQFPNKEQLKLKGKDILEKDIDKRFYLDEEKIKRLYHRSRFGDSIIDLNDGIIQKHMSEINSYFTHFPTLTVTDTQNIFIKSKSYSIFLNEKTRNVEDALFVPQATSFQKDKPVQLDLYHMKYGSEIRPLSTYIPQGEEFRCLQTSQKEILIYKDTIRKLTPKECFRLMGFLNDEINLNGLSDNQCYKLAGNGWDINLVGKIFKQLFK